MLIIVEGGDGSGKSTLCKQLSELDNTDVVRFERGSQVSLTDYIELAMSTYNYVLDRSFITDIVYRILDNGERESLSFVQMATLFTTGRIKVVYCETRTQYEDSIKRGEDNIVDKKLSDRLKDLYRVVLTFLEKYANIPVMRYNWKAGNLSEVCEFINTGKILPKNKINHMEVRYGV